MKTLLLTLSTFFYAIILLGQDGSLDNTFSPGTGPNGTVYVVSQNPDGKLMASGTFTSYNGTAIGGIVRLNLDGTIDNSFTPGTGLSGGGAWRIAYQSDKKMVLVGYFSSINGSARSRIARLNTDGTVDNSFTVGTGFDNTTAGLAIQSDGKIIVGGSFGNYNGTARNGIVRLNTDGTLDNTFSIGTGFNQAVRDLILQPDGKIIVAGVFTAYNGTGRNYIARLNSDGSLDNTFTIGTGGNGQIYSVALQSDGKVLIGGQFSSFNGTGAAYLARLNADGSLDNTFSTITGASTDVRSIMQLSDGKIFIAGNFITYKGATAVRVARLTSSGLLDAGFNSGTGASANIFSAIQLSGGKIAIGGTFTNYNSTGMNYLAVLQNTGGSLPLQFGNLNLTRLPQATLLSWYLTDMEGNETMYVQRKTERTDWTTIQQFPVVAGKKNYEYKDPENIKGTVSYRIQITSTTGTNFYSTTKSILLSTNTEQKAFILKGSIIADARVHLTVYTNEPIGLSDMNGKLIRFYYLSPGEHQININDLPKGLYFMQCGNTVSRFVAK